MCVIIWSGQIKSYKGHVYKTIKEITSKEGINVLTNGRTLRASNIVDWEDAGTRVHGVRVFDPGWSAMNVQRRAVAIISIP